MSDLVIHNARVFCGVDEEVLDNGTVWVSNGLIKYAGSSTDVPEIDSGVERYDAEGKFVMPGMTESHVHLSYNNAHPQQLNNQPLPIAMLDAVDNARVLLGSGFTSAISFGSAQGLDIPLRDAINSGRIPGPRLAASDRDLGSTGSNAFSLSGSKSNTTFAALKAQNQVNNDLTLTGIATLAKSDMTRPDNSFVNSANSVKSSSVSLIASQKNLIGNDNLSLSVSQPNRVSEGDMSIRLSNLAESDGSISYRNSNINLEPTGRQLAYGLSYRKDLDENIEDLFEIHKFAMKILKADTHSFSMLKGATIQHSDLMFDFERINFPVRSNISYEFIAMLVEMII